MPKTKRNRLRVGVVTLETLRNGTIALARLLPATAASAQPVMATRSQNLLVTETALTIRVRGPIQITESDVLATDAVHLRHRAGTFRTGQAMEGAEAIILIKKGRVDRQTLVAGTVTSVPDLGTVVPKGMGHHVLNGTITVI